MTKSKLTYEDVMNILLSSEALVKSISEEYADLKELCDFLTSIIIEQSAEDESNINRVG